MPWVSCLPFVAQKKKNCRPTNQTPTTRDCPAQERSWLHQDVHDFRACYHTLVTLTTCAPQGQEGGRTRRRQRRREDLLGLLEAMAQLLKRRHDRRLLLHSLGTGLGHFLASLLLALVRRTAELWGALEGAQKQEEGTTEALVFLVACLLLTVQAFNGSIPAYPHSCRLLERRMRRISGDADLLMPPHPWSAPRVARMCAGDAAASGWDGRHHEAAGQNDDDGELLERSMRGLALHESWSRLALHEGMLPAILLALRLSLRVSGAMAERGHLVHHVRADHIGCVMPCRVCIDNYLWALLDKALWTRYTHVACIATTCAGTEQQQGQGCGGRPSPPSRRPRRPASLAAPRRLPGGGIPGDRRCVGRAPPRGHCGDKLREQAAADGEPGGRPRARRRGR